jgi:hypothetical protein
MQTFLPNHQIKKSAKMLDNKRLFKQVVEGYQILNTLLNGSKWGNHPAVLQWEGHESFLVYYTLVMADEAWDRGIKALPMKQKITDLVNNCKTKQISLNNPTPPSWLGRPDIHASHRRRLLLKGEIDAVCDQIKKTKKLKSINKWLKSEGLPEKNMLRTMDLKIIYNYCHANNITVPNKTANWYHQWGWTEQAGDDYVWPVTKEDKKDV